MTKTTANRQLSLLIQGILKKYQIDNLQMEIDIVTSVHRLFTEGDKDPAKMVTIREDILNAMLGQGALQNKLAEMEGRVKACTGISIDGRSRYDNMLRFLVDKEEKKSQTIEQYSRWCRENVYDAPKFFKIAEKPDLLMMTWDMAFQNAKPVEKKDIAKDANGVPMW